MNNLLKRQSVLNSLRLRAVYAVAFSLLLLASCTDNAITQVAKGLQDVAVGIAAVQNTVIAGNKAGAISDQDTGTIMQLCGRVNVAGQQVSAVVRSVNALGPAQKVNIVAVMQPIVAAVQAVLTDNTLINIKDQTVRTNVQLGLTAIQTALAVVMVATGGQAVAVAPVSVATPPMPTPAKEEL